MSSKDRIFSKIRAGLGPNSPTVAAEAERRSAVERRLAMRERHLVPARVAGKSQDELVAILRRWLEAAAGEVIEAASEADVPAAIAGYLRGRNLPARVRTGDDTFLASLPWASEPTLLVEHGRATPDDAVGVTHALAAVAETGTLVVPSGAANPVTLSFLPETNIAVVRRVDVVAALEDGWMRVRAASLNGASNSAPNGGLPRTVNLISGPSRSADIGGIPVLGAHGPKRLCLIVVGA